MPSPNELGRSLVIGGLLVACIGLILWSGLGRSWIGRLPGDVHLRRGNLQVCFPLMTCLLVSLLLTLLSWLFRGRR